jgi:hypothetical protein
MSMKSRWFFFVVSGLWLAAHAQADVIAVGPAGFPDGTTVLDFASLVDGTEVNGLTLSGVHFVYTIGGSPRNGAVQIDQGPGTTNHITVPNILSVGDNTGVLSVNLPSSVNLFGYGFAIFSEEDVADATRISAFNGTTLVGSLSFFGTPDPFFTGGFAGIQSTTAFNRLELTFNSSVAPAFALDNLAFASTVPEPSSLFLAALGFGVVTALLRKRGVLRVGRGSVIRIDPT